MLLAAIAKIPCLRQYPVRCASCRKMIRDIAINKRWISIEKQPIIADEFANFIIPPCSQRFY